MKKRILLVDDDEMLHFVYNKVFSAAEIVSDLRCAANGKAAMDFLKERVLRSAELPEIILLDIDMPVMNGFEFIEQFRQWDFPEKESITIVVFTSSLNPKDKERAFSMGVKYFLTKPYILEGIKEIINLVNRRPPVTAIL